MTKKGHDWLPSLLDLFHHALRCHLFNIVMMPALHLMPPSPSMALLVAFHNPSYLSWPSTAIHFLRDRLWYQVYCETRLSFLT